VLKVKGQAKQGKAANLKDYTGRTSGVNGSVTLGDGLTQRGRYPGDESHPEGSRGEDPIGGLVDEPPTPS